MRPLAREARLLKLRHPQPRRSDTRTAVPAAKKQVVPRTWREQLRPWCRYVYLRLVRQNETPKKVVKGLGLGVFLGFFPTFGVRTALAALISTWTK